MKKQGVEPVAQKTANLISLPLILSHFVRIQLHFPCRKKNYRKIVAKYISVSKIRPWLPRQKYSWFLSYLVNMLCWLTWYIEYSYDKKNVM